jgi:hypothetical protein
MKNYVKTFEQIVIGPDGQMQATSDEFSFTDFKGTELDDEGIKIAFSEFLRDISRDMNKLNLEDGMKVDARKKISQALADVLMTWASAQ